MVSSNGDPRLESWCGCRWSCQENGAQREGARNSKRPAGCRVGRGVVVSLMLEGRLVLCILFFCSSIALSRLAFVEE